MNMIRLFVYGFYLCTWSSTVQLFKKIKLLNNIEKRTSATEYSISTNLQMFEELKSFLDFSCKKEQNKKWKE